MSMMGNSCVRLPTTVVISYCKPSSNTSQLFEQLEPEYQTFDILLETSNLETTQPIIQSTPANLATRSFTGKPDWRLKLTVVFQWGVFPRNPHIGSEDPTSKARGGDNKGARLSGSFLTVILSNWNLTASQG